MILYFSQFTDRIIDLEHTNDRILAEPDCSFKKKPSSISLPFC